MASTNEYTVLQTLPRLDFGGVERGTVEIAKALTEHGYKAVVVSEKGFLNKELDAIGATHYEIAMGRKNSRAVNAVKKFRRLLCDSPVEIVHARSRLPAWVAWLAIKSLPAKRRPIFMTTAHGFYSVNKYSAIMAKGEKVVAVSNAIKQYLITQYKVNPERICVIHRGIDKEQYPFGCKPGAKWLADWNTQFPQFANGYHKMVCLPGRITRLKGHEMFIDLIHELNCKGENIHGLIVGPVAKNKQAYYRELVNKVTRLELEENIHFLGGRKDLQQIMAVCDLVLAISNKPESFGRTTLESLNLGIPVAGFNQGGVGEILGRVFVDGLVKNQDFQSLLTVSEKLLAKHYHLSPFDDFSLAEMKSKTIKLYDTLIQQRNMN